MNPAIRSKNNSARLCVEFSDGNKNFHRGDVFQILGDDGFLVKLMRASYRIAVPPCYIQPVVSS